MHFRVYNTKEKKYVTDDSEWVIDSYGNLLFIFGDETFEDNDCIVEWGSQIEDKNGTELFEGDIIRTQICYDRPYSNKRKGKQHIGVVKHHTRQFHNDFLTQVYDAEWEVKIPDMEEYGCCNWNLFFECERIGNIHDNFDLLSIKEKI